MNPQLLARCQPLDGAQGVPAVPAQRKARREYENRPRATGGFPLEAARVGVCPSRPEPA
ncbi:hypothetical protein [Streptomyces sp. NPDC049887]|uniref:hypothetical protein n=1 Tax=Streptomyces sp. NPDC049887 TaxID=3155654 RepID=UPI0034354155